MKPTLVILTCSWLFIAIGWFAPQVFKIVGAALYALGEACEAMRGVFDRSYRQSRRKGPGTESGAKHSEQLSGVQSEVLEALVSQGAGIRAAREKVARATAELPANATFDEVWRKAVAA